MPQEDDVHHRVTLVTMSHFELYTRTTMARNRRIKLHKPYQLYIEVQDNALLCCTDLVTLALALSQKFGFGSVASGSTRSALHELVNYLYGMALSVSSRLRLTHGLSFTRSKHMVSVKRSRQTPEPDAPCWVLVGVEMIGRNRQNAGWKACLLLANERGHKNTKYAKTSIEWTSMPYMHSQFLFFKSLRVFVSTKTFDSNESAIQTL